MSKRILSIDGGFKNLAFINANYMGPNIELNDFGIIDLVEGEKVKDVKFEVLIDRLSQKIKEINTDFCDYILIENPPSLKNPKLKSITICIYFYFRSLGLNCYLVSPSRKLSKDQNKMLSYNDRKKQGIIKTFDLLNDLDKEKITKKYKKIDDICDCIIQAKAYYEKLKL